MNPLTLSLFSLSINSISVTIPVQIPVCVLIILVIATHLHNLFGHLKFFDFWANTNLLNFHPHNNYFIPLMT